MRLAVSLALAYALGSLPTGLLVARAFGEPDVRRSGSGSSGAANVLRVVGWRAALPVVLVDLAKGWLAAQLVILAAHPGTPLDRDGLGLLGGLAAVVGHVWPLLAGGRGGRGVATAGGAVLAVAPLAFALALAAFIAFALATRYVSVASLAAAVMLPLGLVLARWLGSEPIRPAPLAIASVISLTVLFTHRANLERLHSGQEPKLGVRPQGFQ
ncbi:MAG TPA: glycerol-3-phosphate 1-O-acyltransferase PlsY [Candidatus Polarisedimenticolaceae bacterium]|nr:glycerol-3-phosphate 1-O-acyltransferase PlsY [Candidatus Polarisedimenticolaceae bacterium]